MKRAFIDLETLGVQPTAPIIQIGVVITHNEEVVLEKLINLDVNTYKPEKILDNIEIKTEELTSEDGSKSKVSAIEIRLKR